MWFKTVDKMKTRTISVALTNAVQKKSQQDIDDVVRLLTLFILCSLLVTTSCTCIGWGYIKGLKDIKKIKTYDWAAHVLDTLLASLEKHRTNKVRGCLIVVPYVLLETFKICAPVNTKETVLGTRWNLVEFFKQMKVKGNVDIVCQVKKLPTKATTSQSETLTPSTSVIDISSSGINTNRLTRLKCSVNVLSSTPVSQVKKLKPSTPIDIESSARILQSKSVIDITTPKENSSSGTNTGRATRSKRSVNVLSPTPVSQVKKLRKKPKKKNVVEHEQEIDDEIEKMIEDTDLFIKQQDPTKTINETIESLAEQIRRERLDVESNSGEDFITPEEKPEQSMSMAIIVEITLPSALSCSYAITVTRQLQLRFNRAVNTIKLITASKR